MIQDIIKNLEKDMDTRKMLIELKALLKEEKNKYALLYQLGNDVSLITNLLSHEDAKVRKNAALILGQFNHSDCLQKLYEAYEKETQLFVKSSYLSAIKEMDYHEILPKLRNRLEEIKSIIPEESNKKHFDEERKLLTELVLAIDGMKKHTFCGWNVPSRLILLTNRNYQFITEEQLQDYNPKIFNAGVVADVDNLEHVMSIRTVQDVLFQLEDIKSCEKDPRKAAEKIAKSSLLTFLEKRHKEKAPFYFRIELKSKMDLSKKSSFTKKMAGELERLSKQNLINSTSCYEVEIRFIENKEGNLNILIKLYTIPDTRFSYRKQAAPVSIQPVNAALLVALSKDYLKEDAQVLDPFCGVGTMLIERHKLVKANTMYGIDIFGKTIEMARENTENARCIVHYINRDFFDFQHEYLFDEIITNMPSVRGQKGEDEIADLYQKFFAKADKHLNESGIIIMYSHNKEFVKKYNNKSKFKIVEEFEISMKEGTYLFILQRKK